MPLPAPPQQKQPRAERHRHQDRDDDDAVAAERTLQKGSACHGAHGTRDLSRLQGELRPCARQVVAHAVLIPGNVGEGRSALAHVEFYVARTEILLLPGIDCGGATVATALYSRGVGWQEWRIWEFTAFSVVR
jgi:hypothetical protein